MGEIEGISICISAWKTENYIEKCLDSIFAQSWFKEHDNWEILIGVDACEVTLAKIMSIIEKYRNVRVFMMNENVGTYIASNTIMMEAKYNWLLRFDSDDVMYPNAISTLMTNCDGYEVCRFKSDGRGSGYVVSSILIRKDIFQRFGGYQAWRCEADNDMCTRLNKNTKMKLIPKSLFKYTSRNDSITRDKTTGYASPLRRSYRKHTREVSTKNPIIEMVTAGYHEVIPSEYVKPEHLSIPKSEKFENVEPKESGSNKIGFRAHKSGVKRRVVTRHSTFMNTY